MKMNYLYKLFKHNNNKVVIWSQFKLNKKNKNTYSKTKNKK